MSVLGYEFLRRQPGVHAFPLRRVARVRPVTRVERLGAEIAVPRSVAPDGDDLLDHVLFALKHEGTNLQVLAQALPLVEPGALLACLRAAPNGRYIRIACHLWERFTCRTLDDIPVIGGQTVLVFDPETYVTAPGVRDARWRVQFNGLGSFEYCATVERTPQIKTGMDSDILGRANAFLREIGPGMADRALAWAYLHETESSFEIERETPSQTRSEAYVALLRQAHEKRPLDEEYLAALQSATVLNPFDRAVGFRDTQNWLRGPIRGAAGVTYIPPPPALASDLMFSLMQFANESPRQIDPIVAAAVSSFGFVFIHPFMDGNGRLSRFLFHQALCQSGRLEHGMLLPVSVAMRRHEDRYLAALQSFSKPARAFWQVSWIDEDHLDFEFNGSPAVYRFWDATECVEFSFQMAAQALDKDLRQETEFLRHYDALYRAINDEFDVRNNDLATLVLTCLQHDGRVSKRRRKQFAERVPAAVFDALERHARAQLYPDLADLDELPDDLADRPGLVGKSPSSAP